MGILTKEDIKIINIEVGYLCNQCGKCQRIDDCSNMEAENISDNNHKISVVGSSFSSFPSPLTKISFVLCSECLKAMVDNFKVAPDFSPIAYDLDSK